MSNYLATFGKPRFLGIVRLTDEERDLIKRDRLMVVVSHRGEELAEFVGPLTEEQETEYRSMRTITEHGEGPIRGGEPIVTDLEFVRIPSIEDMEDREKYVAEGDETMRAAQELVVQHGLDVKLVDSEMLLGGKKLFFYFTADTRVDFRTLVKDLARRFRTRIELRQMGVRDEARIIHGLSSCGLPCCCSYWLNNFSPIGIKMVKEQNIALNPAKISGICGRLMCCMAFEHKTYKSLWASLPGPGTKIKTPSGSFMIAAVDVAREAVRIHRPIGGDISVPIKLFEEFREAVMKGEEWEVPEDEMSEFDRRRLICLKDRSSAAEAFDFSEFEKPSAPRTDEQDSEHTSDSKHKRRRGRRGAKRDGGEQMQTQTQTARPHRPRAGRETMGEDERLQDGSSDAVDPHRRPRRRRRRPGARHGDAGGEQ